MVDTPNDDNKAYGIWQVVNEFSMTLAVTSLHFLAVKVILDAVKMHF